MVDRRTFTALVVGSLAAPRVSLAQSAIRSMFYSAIGPDLTLYAVDTDQAILNKRGTVSTPANIQYAWPHPSKKFLYVVCSNGGSSSGGGAGSTHVATVFAIDQVSGALTPHGAPVTLVSRPIHTSVDMSGKYLFIAYNDPSNLSIHRINADGTLGVQLKRPSPIDTGIYAHQVRATPDNQQVFLVTRGNNAPGDNPVNPGSIKTFGFSAGALNTQGVFQTGDGMQFGPRHLDFHPSKPWVYVSIESQNKLYAYWHDPEVGLVSQPMFIKDTLSDPASKLRQAAGPIHVHPNGRFVYLTNRAFWTTDFEGQQVFAGGENSVAVFAIDQTTGEPTLIQNADAQAIYLRTFAIDPLGRVLVTASVFPMAVRGKNQITTVPAAISVFRIGPDGKLEFMRKYEVDATTQKQQFWSGMVTLP
jgi:6-phosphogluconolactonase